MPTPAPDTRPWLVFWVFLRLGLSAFGGPIAHLAYFRDEFVIRRQWLSEHHYADLVALCQFLPGPASSQVGIAIGMLRAGYAGALAAWLGFTLPSAIALVLFALGLTHYGEFMPAGVLEGLKIVAVAIVAQALWAMGRKFCTDLTRIILMLLSAGVVLLFPSVWTPIGVLLFAATIGLLYLKPQLDSSRVDLPQLISARTALCWLLLFFSLLLGLPILNALFPSPSLALLDAFYRAGALVFGGGHVLLPLLQTEVVSSNAWLSEDRFLAGYAATQAVPGPLFTFAAFLGASMQDAPSGWLGALICLLAIFMPSFFLVFGSLPFWEILRRQRQSQAALLGVNAAVVGLLLAAFYQPIWQSSIHRISDVALAGAALAALMIFKISPLWVVIGCGLIGGLIGAFG